MNYTDLATVKNEILSGGNAVVSSQYDVLIERLISAASRDIDEYCAGAKMPASLNYFEMADVVDELTYGLSDVERGMVFWPHKPTVLSVSAVATRFSPRDAWLDRDVSLIELNGGSVYLWDSAPGERFQVKVSYNGGWGTSVADLPANLVEVATVLAARYFKEASTGLSDSIGTVELGIVSYTKTMPARVKAIMDKWQRVQPW